MSEPNPVAVFYKELRFILEPEITQVFILASCEDDFPPDVCGWHHKAFPASQSVETIARGMVEDRPYMWPLEAPPKGET
jgi:hypothetical protein